jgi:hypothetical protein
LAELNFEIEGKHGEVAASVFNEAVFHAVGLLREFDSAISGKPRGSLRWYIENLHSNGRLLVGFRSRTIPPKKRRERTEDIGPAVTSSFLTGFEDLENKCETPPYLSEFGLRRADELASLIGERGPSGFRFTSENRAIAVTSKTSENISKLLPIKRTAIGSVEGKMEAINLHRKPRVIIYHSITNKAVTCEFDAEKFMDQVKDDLGQRVVVFGMLHKNINGDTLRVSTERIIRPEDLASGHQEDPTWSDPEFASASSTAEYIRRIRGGG